MRRDVQLFLGKQVVNPPSTGENLVSNPSINDETDYDFVNHSTVIGGQARLNSLRASEANFSQTISDLQPNKKYQLRVSNLSYDAESLVVNRAFSSEDFTSTVWTKSNVTVTSNSTVAPDGTTTADSLLSSSIFATTYQPLSVEANEPIVISAYVKSNTASNATLNIFKDNISFNTSTLAISSSSRFSDVGSIYAGNGWYRVYGTYTNTSSSNVVASVKLPDNGQSMYVWGFQLERADSLGLYVRNSGETTLAYSYVNQTQQTVENKLLYSEDISNSAWNKTRVNLTSGIDGFLGNNLGFALTSQSTNQTSYIFEDTPITEDGDYVVTTYVKANTATYATFRVQSTDDGRLTDHSLRFSDGLLSDKSTSSGFLTSIESTYMYNGWWKVEFYVNLTTSTGNLRIIASQRSSDGSWFTSVGAISSMSIAHTQIIKGSVAGQYIPTFGSAMALGKQDNLITIYDASNKDGGLLYSSPLRAGTTSFVHDFITNDNTGDLIIEIEAANGATSQIEIDSLHLSQRIDAYYSTERFAVDMFDFEDLNVVDKIKDVRDISKVFTEYSQKFTVPASANNNQLFDHFYNEDVVSGFDHRVKHDAVIKIGGADYKHGQLTLLSSTVKNGKPHSYSVVFYGNTVKLNDLLGDDQLSDLTGTILDKLNIEYNSGNIFDLMTNGMFFDENNDLVVGTDNGVYADTPDLFVPFISCDSHYFYDSVDQAQVKDRVSSRNVKFGSAQATRGIYYKDLKLAVKIKYIIQAIEEKYGVTFSDDFFNDSIKEYSELSMLLHREKGGISSQLETSTDSFTLSDLSIFPTFSTLGNTDFRGVARYGGSDIGWDRDYLDFVYANSSFNQQGLERGYYSHKIEFDVEVVGSGEYSIDVIDTSEFGPENTGFSWRGTGNRSVELIFRGGEDNNNSSSSSAALSFGVRRYFYKPRFTVSTQAGISEYKITNFKLTPVRRQASSRYGSPVSAWDEQSTGRDYRYNDAELNQLNEGVALAGQLPNMKVIDFLTSLFKTFNLTAYSVPDTDLSEYAGQIRVRPLDAYYLSGNEVDISPYVDTSKKVVNRNKLFSEVNFEFDKLSTLAAIKAFERTGDTFGNERMNNLSASLQNPLAFDGGKYSVKTKFEKVMYERMTDQSDESTILPIQWGWMASKDENPIVGKPLLFYPIYQGVSGTIDEQGDIVALDYDTSIYDKNKNVIAQSHAQFDSYIRPSNCLQFNGSSINFGSEYDEWYVWEGSGSNENSLFNNYYSNYLLSIYDIQSRLISIETHLPVEVVMKLKLNDVVIINKKRFRINSLDLNITTGAAKMELMNDLVYGSLYVEAISVVYKQLVSGVYKLDIVDYSSNSGTSYKIYANGVFIKEFIGTYGIVYDSELSSGLNEVTVRKCAQYDANTSQESYDSNIIEITV